MRIARAFLDFLCGIVALIAIATLVFGIKHNVYVAIVECAIELIMAKGLFDIAHQLSDGGFDDATGEA